MSRLQGTELSMLDLVPVRGDGTATQALHYSLDLARYVERLGFKRFWLAEHHNMDGVASSATSVLIGYIAGGTSSIRVGSGGVMLPNHPPLVVAEQFGTLACLYPDRIDLGLGRAPGADPLTMRALRREALSADDFPQQVQELNDLLGPVKAGQRLIANPGAGTNVPIWLLGSSLFSAQLAAERGLPYAFASHFAPRFMLQAIDIYRDRFRPSAVLDKPHVMVGVPVLAAPTDDEAHHLATTAYQRILALLRGQSLLLQPPVGSMDGLWHPHEKQAVMDFLGEAVIGGPQTVANELELLLERTQADELMIVSDFYQHEHRLRSCDIVAGVKDGRLLDE